MRTKILWRQMRSVYKKEYIQWIKNPRMIVVVLLFVMIREIVVLPMKGVAMQMNQPLNVLEPIIASVNSGIILLLIPLVYLVIVADFPKVDGNTYYYLPRIGRLNWILAQILFQIGSLFTYIICIILAVGIQVSSDSFLINGWSMVTTDRSSFDVNAVMDNLVPLNLYYQMSPYQAFVMSFSLLFLFLFLCSGIMLLASLYGKKTIAFWGIIINAALGIVLCAVKSKWMWLFPVSHSILWIHYQEYYRDYVFAPWLSVCLLVCLDVCVMVAVLCKARKVNLDILREEHE